MTYFSGWQTFLQKAEAGAPLTVVYIGGSVTWGATASNPQETSWRALTGQWLRTEFPKSSFRFVDAAIGGTGSQLGVFRVPRDVLRFDPDLVFVEFSINDAGLPPEKSQESYEGILRMLLHAKPHIAIVPVILGGYEEGEFGSPVGDAHLEMAQYYGLPAADIHPRMNQVIREQGLKKTDFLTDGIHPTDFGYRLYAEAVQEELKVHMAAPPAVLDHLPDPLRTAKFETATAVDPATLPIPEHWHLALPANTGPWFDGVPSRFITHLVMSEVPDASYFVTFKSAVFGLFFQSSAAGGVASVQIDGGPAQRIETFSGFQENEHLAYQLLSTDLPAGQHTIGIVVTGDKHPQSQGIGIRIGALLVNGPVESSTAEQLQKNLSGKTLLVNSYLLLG